MTSFPVFPLGGSVWLFDVAFVITLSVYLSFHSSPSLWAYGQKPAEIHPNPSSYKASLPAPHTYDPVKHRQAESVYNTYITVKQDVIDRYTHYRKRHIHHKRKPNMSQHACYLVFCTVYSCVGHTAVNCTSADDSERHTEIFKKNCTFCFCCSLPSLTEAHAWHKGREEAEGVLAKIISGVVTPTFITLNRKGRISTKSQGESQTNRPRQVL